MKLLSCKSNDEVRLAVRHGNDVIDTGRLDSSLPSSLEELLSGGKESLDALRAALEGASAEKLAAAKLPEDFTYAPAVSNPQKILCIGLNYCDHSSEINMKLPDSPALFSKFNNALIAHEQTLALPKAAHKFDYEAELVIVIGKRGRDIPEQEALSHVFGYTCGNDFSARDLQMRTTQWLLGKSCDGFAPIGPHIVTADEIPDPQKLGISCRVNGVVTQQSDTSHMIFGCAYLVSYISRYITLEPGDVIFTGTPSGVILGKAESEQNWLKAGDRVEITIEGIGTLANTLT